ncbi:MAG TPA: hypothetical protein VFT17_02220 [Propionibacteriaceae bacterium]|nr:hypothetical protein [Propionibacteriaceae bacterium]
MRIAGGCGLLDHETDDMDGDDMRFGVHLPVAGKGASPETILQVAVEGERIDWTRYGRGSG